jgi:putative transposase
MQTTVPSLATQLGVTDACRVLGVPRSSYYRWQRRQTPAPPPRDADPDQRDRDPVGALPDAPDDQGAPATAAVPPAPLRALSATERAQVRAVLNSERFADCAPREVYATLLDEGTYLCSWSTMYRILRATGESQRRRDRPRRGAYAKPELLATGPRQLWSWDITKLKGPAPWTYFSLYVIIDVYSRYVVGWMIADRESAELAEVLIAETCAREGIAPGQLTLHADRGSAMTSKSVAQLLSDLGVNKSHARPSVSDDNPYSEAQFKTVKYHPTFPERFGSREDAQTWARPFFAWYNHEHHHSGIGLLTPATVHHGHAPQALAARQTVLTAAYQAHPGRFVRGHPHPPTLPTAVWINPPATYGTASPLAGTPAAEETVPTQAGSAGAPTTGEAAAQAARAQPARSLAAPPEPALENADGGQQPAKGVWGKHARVFPPGV